MSFVELYGAAQSYLGDNAPGIQIAMLTYIMARVKYHGWRIARLEGKGK